MILPAQPPVADIFDITRQTMVMDGITLKILGGYNSKEDIIWGKIGMRKQESFTFGALNCCLM